MSAAPTLSPYRSPEHQAIAEAIVALNFNNPQKALDILLGALTDINFQNWKGAN